MRTRTVVGACPIWRGVGAALAVCLMLTGCLRPGEGRALHDLEVGQAVAGGATFVVEDGLATVRQVERREIELWGQAPSLSILADVSPEDAGTWTLRVRNILPDAALHADGTAVVSLLERPLPTVGVWEVQLPAGETRLILAAPDADAREPFHFAVLSDVQEALPEVGDIYAVLERDRRPRFVICAGDLTANGGHEELEEFQRRLEALSIPFFATLGNHELYSLEGASADSWFELFGRANLHFGFQGVKFTLVDSGDGMIDPLVYGWLDTWLEAGRDDVHIFATHIPPFEPSGTRNGSFGNRSEAAALISRLAETRVDLTIYGHVHSFYAYSNGGIPAYISGGGGAIPEQFDGIGRHYLVVRVDPGGGAEGVSDAETSTAGVQGVEMVRVD